ncbi:LPS assembly lipoprotein LptE [Alloyangia pacifica]|uniref:LPS-assembly lipoprotein n=1 Tax=Alloyangia pacifica TaxID=311180 RepID=A0A1I6U9Z5_9RHOB|nr:LPS assembly lipoprotein LptE [Alloyangia pacifica]SDH43715.1 LPS-assembly lipoprotein [Alloyangia pacifica]SFS98198.1 LPS-assembly lipoprotein [Alloyangia pacifica]
MWSLDRRTLLAACGALALAGCGFTPAYGPQGGGQKLLGQIAFADPDTPDAYLYTRRIEERLGRAAPGAPYRLDTTLSTAISGHGSLADGNTTRIRVIGTATFTLRDTATGNALTSGGTSSFTGYSTTGSTVSTQAAERDAEERLMIMLADRVIDRLLLVAADLPE